MGRRRWGQHLTVQGHHNHFIARHRHEVASWVLSIATLVPAIGVAKRWVSSSDRVCGDGRVAMIKDAIHDFKEEEEDTACSHMRRATRSELTLHREATP